ncbi:hypothetical protein BY458DRAFT_492562 [Sporodiniella umbellata]|nr:hypothetical protein BY458DRAFT_492562 [Sporodiniella umbellata]
MASEEEPVVNPIPSSVIIVNESTPLLSHEQFQAGSTILNTSTPNNKQPSLWSFATETNARSKEIKGIVLLSAASVFFAFISVLVKHVGIRLPSLQIVFARSVIQFFLGLIGCVILKINPLGKKGFRTWILLRAITSSIALCLFFYGLTKLSLVEATVLFFVGPMFKVVFGSGVLNESFTFRDGFYSITCFLGLLFVIKPSALFRQEMVTNAATFGAVTAVLLGAFMSAMAYVTVRKIGQDTHVLVHMVYFGFVASLLSLTRYRDFTMPRHGFYGDGWMLAAVGLFAFLGQFLLNQGLKMAPFGLASVIQTGDVLLAYLFGLFFFQEYPSFSTLLGCFVVVLSTTFININKWRAYQIKNAALKKRRSKDRLIQQQQHARERSS